MDTPNIIVGQMVWFKANLTKEQLNKVREYVCQSEKNTPNLLTFDDYAEFENYKNKMNETKES